MNRPTTMRLLLPTVLLALAGTTAYAAPPLYLSSTIEQQQAASDIPASSIPDDSSHKKFELSIGPEVGIFFPTSSKTQKAYGDSWTSIGIGLGSAYQANVNGSFSPFFTILYNTHDGNRAFVLPIGVAYEKSLTNSPDSGYYGADLVAVGADQRAVGYGVHSGFRFGEGIRPLIGYEFGKQAYVQGSYLFSSSIKGFDFSGATIEAGLRF